MTKYNHLTNSAMQFSRALERCHSGPYISAVHAEIHFNHAVAADFKICLSLNILNMSFQVILHR